MPLLLLAYFAFLGISLPDGLLGVSWPSMSVSFGQPVGALGLVLPFAVVSSMLSSASTGVLLARIGLGKSPSAARHVRLDRRLRQTRTVSRNSR